MSSVFVFAAVCCLLSIAQGGTECNGMLKGMHIDDDVEVGKMGCSLMETHVKGDVKSGAEMGGGLSLKSTTVDGIVIEQSSGTISIDKSVIKPNGLKVYDCTSTLKICGTSVSEVIEFKSCTGNFLMKSEGACSGNEIYKDVKIKEIKGNVVIEGNTIKGEGAVVIEEVDGYVSIKNAEFHELVIKKVNGQITLKNVRAKSVYIDDNPSKKIHVENCNIEILDCQGNGIEPKCIANNIKDAKTECSNC